MFEVHTGIHPGKPKLALVVSAISLVAALLTAWIQVSWTRSLSAPRALTGTPILVRVPADWTEIPDSPGKFAPAPHARAAQQEHVVHRYVQFEYRRELAFVSPADELRRLVGADVRMRPAPIGDVPGFEIALTEKLRTRYAIIERDSLVRIACSPRGDLIRVTYEPGGRLSAADAELFDEICAAVSIATLRRADSVADAVRNTGFTFEAARDWVLFKTDPPCAAGVYILAMESDAPVWGLAVLPTWLSPSRLARDLLADFGAAAWGETASTLVDRITSRDTPGGVTTAEIRHRGFGVAPVQIPAAHLVLRESDRAALIIVFGDPKRHAVASAAADELARRIEFSRDAGPGFMAAADRAGQRLAAVLSTSRIQSVWGSNPTPWFYETQNGSRTVFGMLVRDPRPTGALTGFKGVEGHISNTGEFFYQRWELGETGEAFERRFASGSLTAGGARGSTEDSRLRGDDRVTRVVRAGRQIVDEVVFECGPSFVSPPLELAAAALVASGKEDSGEALIDVLSASGVGIQSRLLRLLPARDQRGPLLLAIDDYWPDGEVIEFDDDQLPRRVITRGGEFQRLSIDDATKHIPLFEKLEDVLPAVGGGNRVRTPGRGGAGNQ